KVLGTFYTQTKQFAELDKLYRDLLAKKPDSIAARKILGELAFGKGDFDQVKKYTDYILKANADDVEGRFFQARLYIKDKDFEQAANLLTTITVDSPDNGPVYYYLGIAKLGVGKIDEARNALVKATELRPSWITPKLDLASLHLANGDNRLAWQEVQKVLDVFPYHRNALYIAAGAQFKSGNYDKALELFERIQKHYPDDVAVHMGLAGVYTVQFKLAQALSEYEEALKRDPNRLDALNMIAQLLIRQGKTQEALQRVERHEGKVKERAAIYQILGDLSIAAGEEKKGIGYFEKALAVNPATISAYIKIGDIYARRREYDQAIQTYMKAVDRNSRSVQPRMLVAMMYDRKRDYSNANEQYEKILELNPNFSPAANNYAWNIAQQNGNLDVALRWAEKAKEIDPDNPTVTDTLGWVTYKRGLYAKAIDLLKDSSDKLSNKNPTVLYHLGMAYYRGGRRDEAREILGKALSISADFVGADEAKRTLSVLNLS